MFDLGFSKIALIGAVALIVLGPERLPRIARVAGTLFGRAQRYVRDVKAEVSRDMALDELAELKNLSEHVRQEFDAATQTVRDSMNEARDDFQAENSNRRVGQAYTSQPYIQSARRNGRNSWRVKSGRTPLWFKQQTGVKKHVISEAARMARHRSYAAHLRQKSHSFFG